MNEAQGEIICQKYTDTVTTFMRYPHFSFEKASLTTVISCERPAKYFYAGINSGNESFSHLYYEDSLSRYVEYMENSVVLYIDGESIPCTQRMEPYGEGEVLSQGGCLL
ncbi:MAG: hypothetical protein E7256_13920 [Lachnospiraceae bacterium]|nr:hypothetical protein [Lachnospiraceae bacterium]